MEVIASSLAEFPNFLEMIWQLQHLCLHFLLPSVVLPQELFVFASTCWLAGLALPEREREGERGRERERERERKREKETDGGIPFPVTVIRRI